jgi:hypothetical protein
MNTRLMIPAILGAAMLSTPVLAGGTYSMGMSPDQPTQTAAAMADSGMCTALERHFDREAMPHEKVGWTDYAKGLRAEGGKLCSSGKYDQGVNKLQAALSYLSGGNVTS